MTVLFYGRRCKKTMIQAPFSEGAFIVKKATKKRVKRREWTKADIKELKVHSKARTPVIKLAKMTRRSAGALRQKALNLGIGLGHQR
ncbi:MULTISPECIES: hypothetical protein [unclassified Bradyrhizobium]|uniref:hypothetical protein n=1 Tax=unclassified Bradyrhizobium TaxID=2631580 RepID=UPI0023061D29|nr:MULTISPECIES: hypothetical protein [unclassified Bradyrhizobium]